MSAWRLGSSFDPKYLIAERDEDETPMFGIRRQA